jgi:hypothetical protein
MWPIPNPSDAAGGEADRLAAFRAAREKLRRHILAELLATD